MYILIPNGESTMKFYALMALLSLMTLAMPAQAQTESQTYDPTHTTSEDTATAVRQQLEKTLGEKGFISPSEVQISVIHESYMEPGQFGIQMLVPDMVSGCYKISPLEYESSFIGQTLDVKVKRYRRVAPDNAADSQNCSPQNKMAAAVMVFEKEDFKTRDITEIRFSTEAGRDTYKVAMTDDTLALIPQSMTAFKANNLEGELKDRLVYYFSGANTIAIHVPMANPGEDLNSEILSFATARMLTPVQSGTTMSLSEDRKATYYFEDKTGRFASMIGPEGYAEIGTISVMRPFDGPEGRTETPVELRVFVTKPGTTL